MWVFPSTICRSAREEAVSTWDCHLLSEACAQSLVWNTKPLPSKSWLRQWKRIAWMQRLYGRICEPSTAARGVESWIQSLRDTRANRLVEPVAAVDARIRDTCGHMSCASLAKCNPASYSPKMLQAISVSDSSKSCKIWRGWVTELRRDCSRRQKWAQATSGKDSSFSRWPTPTARDFKTPNSEESQAKRNKGCARGQQLMNFVAHSFHLDPETSQRGDKSLRKTAHLPRLNPKFVCWLMGYPETVAIGSGFSEIQWSRSRQRMRSALCGLLSDINTLEDTPCV